MKLASFVHLGVLLWHRPRRKVRPIRAQYLKGSGPMRVVHFGLKVRMTRDIGDNCNNYQALGDNIKYINQISRHRMSVPPSSPASTFGVKYLQIVGRGGFFTFCKYFGNI